jgi:RNA polymerase sigma factor (sigma-70 family)
MPGFGRGRKAGVRAPDGVLDYLRRLTNPGALAAQPDGALLRHFAERRDEAAFAALLQRHGPMVLAACRRMLSSAQDAEDAFQATFLVLARRAGQVGRPERLGPWLYGVALRVARRLRRDRPAQQLLDDVPERILPTDRDLQVALDEELARLPARYREALVLCCLEGLSREEAAERLGTTEGAVKGLLERGRERLWQRLVRRGVAPSLPGALPLAGVPLQLASVTVRGAAGGVVSTNVLELVKGAVAEMSLTRWKTILALGLVALACSGVGLTMQTTPTEKPKDKKQAEAAKPSPTKPGKIEQEDTGEAKPAEDRIQPGRFLLIRVKDALPDAPIDGIFEVEPSGKVPLGPEYGRVNLNGLTYEEGEAALKKHLEKLLKPGFKVMIISGDGQNVILHSRGLGGVGGFGALGGGLGALGGGQLGGGFGALGGAPGGGLGGGGMGGMAAAAGQRLPLYRAITELTAEIRELRKAIEEANKKGK